MGISLKEMVRGPIWDPEKEPRAPAVSVNHWWETRSRYTQPCPCLAISLRRQARHRGEMGYL